jgi:hypothetical protein
MPENGNFVCQPVAQTGPQVRASFPKEIRPLANPNMVRIYSLGPNRQFDRDLGLSAIKTPWFASGTGLESASHWQAGVSMNHRTIFSRANFEQSGDSGPFSTFGWHKTTEQTEVLS